MLPPIQRSSPLLFSILPPPSTILPPPSSTPPPPSPPLSTLPPSNVTHGPQPSNVYYVRLPVMLQPSNVTLVRPSYFASPPLPTMLPQSHSNSFPPNLVTLPPPPPPKCYTSHSTSVITNTTILTTFLKLTHNLSIPDSWPSGATDTCLPNPDPVPPRHVRGEQLVQEFLHRTGSTGRLSKRRITTTASVQAPENRLVSARAGGLQKQRNIFPHFVTTF